MNNFIYYLILLGSIPFSCCIICTINYFLIKSPQLSNNLNETLCDNNTNTNTLCDDDENDKLPSYSEIIINN